LVQPFHGDLSTKPRYADAIRVLNNGANAAGPPALTPTELLTVTAIAYLHPATRTELSRLAGKEISRDVIGQSKSLDLIAAGPRAPIPDARPMPMSRRSDSLRRSGLKLAQSARYRKARRCGTVAAFRQ
jgi:hypothetical protein